MITKEIPRERWAAFCDDFSRMNEDVPVSVEVISIEIGDQREVRWLPLRGVTAELDGGRGDTVEIMLGGAAREHVTHAVAAPVRIRHAQTEAGGPQALEIVTAGGVTTLLRFRPLTRAVEVG